jgi:NAD(P)H-flavin reductase/ferredoxin
MSGITFEGRAYPYREGETILEALLRGGAPVTYSCRRGNCQTCILQVDGDDGAGLDQARLPRARPNECTFLACQTRAVSVSVKRVDRRELFEPARVVENSLIRSDVLRLRLEPPGTFVCRPGQFVNIRHPSGGTRAYAVTSVLFVDFWLELHVQMFEGGLMSSWLRNEVRIGDFVQVQGPFGDFHYDASMTKRSLLLVGDDVSAGALIGIARDAALRGHEQPASLYYIVRQPHQSCLSTITHAPLGKHPKLTITEIPASSSAASHRDPASLDAVLLPGSALLANTTIFLCGEPELVRRSEALVTAHGVSNNDLRICAFNPPL